MIDAPLCSLYCPFSAMTSPSPKNRFANRNALMFPWLTNLKICIFKTSVVIATDWELVRDDCGSLQVNVAVPLEG